MVLSEVLDAGIIFDFTNTLDKLQSSDNSSTNSFTLKQDTKTKNAQVNQRFELQIKEELKMLGKLLEDNKTVSTKKQGKLILQHHNLFHLQEMLREEKR